MSEMITTEVHFFLGSFLSGVLLVAAYDIFRFFRRIVPHSKAVVNTEDIIFWTGASIFIFRMIYQLNDGKIRGFGIFCMICGMLLYHFSLSDGLVEFSYRIFGTSILKIVKFIRRGLKKIIKPFRMMIRKLKDMRKKHRNGEKNEEGQSDEKKCKKE